MKKVVLATLILLATLPSFAEDNKTALATTLVDILNPNAEASFGSAELLDKTTSLQIRAKTLMTELTPAKKEKLEIIKHEFISKINAISDQKVFREKFINIYTESFSEAQIKELIKIYTNKAFVSHEQKRNEIASYVYSDFQRHHAEAQAWLDTEVNKVILEK